MPALDALANDVLVPPNMLRLTRKAPRSRLRPETTSPGALSALKRLLGTTRRRDQFN